MPEDQVAPSSELIRYLPAIFQNNVELDQFLLAFEKILLGRDDVALCYKEGQPVAPDANDPDIVCYQGLEETISNLAAFFDPQLAPVEFLPWLSSWTALALRADLNEKQQRDFLTKVVPLYRWRGTRQSLQELLQIFTIGTPTITETEPAEFQIGVHSTIGKDTSLGEASLTFLQ